MLALTRPRGLLIGIFNLAILCLLWDQAAGQDVCPGRYCGRASSENTTSDCGSCTRGSRVVNHTLCVSCVSPLSPYQWLYLLFMVFIPLAFNIFRIHYHHAKDRINLVALHVSNVLEVLVATILTVLSFQPQGEVNLQTCGVDRIADWYPIFYNPSPDFFNTLHCTSEVVYPLYSIFFVFAAYYLLLVVTARPVLIFKLNGSKNFDSLYDILFFLPAWTLCHATCGGLIYYWYPYLIIVASFISSAAFFALSATRGEVMVKRFFVAAALHVATNVFGISALLVYFGKANLWPLVTISIAPSLLFWVSIKVSHPDALTCRANRNH